MRKLVLAALLVVLPFSGMRVVCVDSPTPVSGSAASTETVVDCERLCPLHPPSDTPAMTPGTRSGTETGSDCALSTDGASFSILATVAVLWPHESLEVPLAVSAVSAASPRFYLDPELAHVAPPPRPRAL